MLEQIGKLIESERKRQKITLIALAQQSGVSYQQICNITHGHNTSLSTVEAILRTLKVKRINIKL